MRNRYVTSAFIAVLATYVAVAVAQTRPGTAAGPAPYFRDDPRRTYESLIEVIYSWHGYGRDPSPRIEETLRSLQRGAEPRSDAYRKLAAAELALRRHQFGSLASGRADARTLAQDVLQTDRELADAHTLIGRLELEDGCARCGGARADAARKLDPAHPEAALLRAFAAAEIGDRPSATRWLREAARLAGERWPDQTGLRYLSRRIELLVSCATAASAWSETSDADQFFVEAQSLAVIHGPGATPQQDGWVRLRHAEHLLYGKGDAAAAAEQAVAAERLTANPEARVLRDLAGYARCVEAPSTQRRKCFAEVDARARVSLQDAFILLARSPRTAAAAASMLDTRAVTNMDARDQHGRTALLHAAAGNNLEMTRRLVNAGADVNAKGSNGERAIVLFARAGNSEAIRYLISKKAGIGEPEEAERLLLFAVQRNDTEIARLLLDRAAQPGRAVDLNMLLRVAALSGNVQTVKLLLKHGADANQRDWSGMTALDYARATGHRELIRLLEGARKTSV